MESSTSAEKTALLTYLAGQRRHVLAALEGLDDEQMSKGVLPSGWAPVQLIHHLAVDDERFWVRAVIAGDEAARSTLSDNGWTVPNDMTVTDVLDLYRAETALSDAVLADIDVDAEPAWWPDFMGERWMDANRDVILHLMVETAAHAGHLDAVRELVDGKQWVVITE
jgi:hypothetical protein